MATSILASGLAAPALAQTAIHRNLDANGIDLTQGDRVWTFEEGAIGSGKARLPLVRSSTHIQKPHVWDAITLNRQQTAGPSGPIETVTVNLGFEFERFVNGVNTKANGGTLSGWGGSYTYSAADGTSIAFYDPTGSLNGDGGFCIDDPAQTFCTLAPATLAEPDGTTVGFEYDVLAVQVEPDVFVYHWRLSQVANSYGYRIAFTYQNPDTLSPGWFNKSGAQFFNNMVSTTTPQRSVSYNYPSGGPVEVTDMAGGVWRFTHDTMTRPGESTPFYSATAGTGSWSVTNEGVTTSYVRSVSGSTATMVVTDALSNTTTIVSDVTKVRPTSVTDALSKTTSMTYDSNGRLTRVTQPEGNYAEVTLDGRSNATQTRAVAKSGSGLSDIVTSATYDTTCADVSCNQPNSVTDARGKTTDFTYDTTHGGVTAATAPSPDGTAPRPEVRSSYTLSNGEYKLTGISACQTASSCASSADEVKTTIAYDAQQNVTSVSRGAGDNSLTATATATYNAMGDVATVDGPLAGADDTTTYRYDNARRLTGFISPDPDGSGALKRRAERRGYDAAGQLITVERGTVTGTDDTAWAAFAPAEKVTTSWANGRKAKEVLSSGGTDYAVTQYGYDALGRLECAAVRVNPATWGALPSSACTLATAGPAGPDRITRYSYDAAGRQTKVQTGYGTGVQADEVTTTYTDNGRIASVTDAEGNRTTYEYDGHDRLKRTRYPDPSTAGISSTSDYEELLYDAGSNVITRRLRGYSSDSTRYISYSYDALNRLTTKDFPATSNPNLRDMDVSFSYDLLGRIASATDSWPHWLSFTYDALGRQTSETSAWLGTTSWTYDAAGRRTRMTWSDGLYVTYDYLTTGEVSAIRENGAASGIGVLAAFGYDDLGRRVSLTRGNGTLTSYGYDAVSRLSSLGHDLAGTGADVTATFSHNPASQIVNRTRSNDAYAFPGFANVNRSDTINGLNQVTAAGSSGVSHDARGNISHDGVHGYGYTAENRLAVSDMGFYIPDAVGRMFVNSAQSQLVRYDGVDRIGEYDSATGAVRRRYVHGPGMDEPLLWYEGSGTSDRRWLHADERGSIVAVTNGAGTAIAVNSYDEYGVPASGNIGTFGYTGQVWLSELGAYYYKARIYNPTLGRFMQTDPIGYGAGLNLYGYVSGDPVNYADPLGLEECPAGGAGTDCDVTLKGKGFGNPAPTSWGSASAASMLGAFRPERQVADSGLASISHLPELPSEVVITAQLSDDKKSSQKSSAGVLNARKKMIITCGKNQGSTACTEAKREYFDAFERDTKQNPLPKATGPEEPSVIEGGWKYFVDPAGCAMGFTGIGAAGRFLGLVGGALTADSCMNTIQNGLGR